MGFMSTLGRYSSRALAYGRLYGDKALANKAAKWGIIGGGAGLFLASRMSNNGFIRGVGNVAGLGAASLGGYWGARRAGWVPNQKLLTGAVGAWPAASVATSAAAAASAITDYAAPAYARRGMAMGKGKFQGMYRGAATMTGMYGNLAGLRRS